MLKRRLLINLSSAKGAYKGDKIGIARDGKTLKEHEFLEDSGVIATWVDTSKALELWKEEGLIIDLATDACSAFYLEVSQDITLWESFSDPENYIKEYYV